MYTKQEIIISSYRDGKSQRTIARELQISRKTVNKYIQEYEATLESSDCKETAGALFLSGNPVYKMTVPRGKLKLTNDVQEFIDKLLSKNKEKLEQRLQRSSSHLKRHISVRLMHLVIYVNLTGVRLNF